MTPFVFIDVRVFDGQRNIRIVLRSNNIHHLRVSYLLSVVDRYVLGTALRASDEDRLVGANDNYPTSPDGVA
jgi:hypothetical protein